MNLVVPLLLILAPIKSRVYGIMGGKNATAKDIVNTISIRSIILDSQMFGTGHYCGAGLLTAEKILTAAHCILDVTGDKYMEAGYMRVVGGTLNKDLMELKSFESSCVAIKPHPGFNFKSRAFDVAIITFKTPVPAQINLKKITLGKSVPKYNETCRVAGWGRTQPGSQQPVYALAQVAEVKRMEMVNCEKMYALIPDNMLCFGAPKVAICRGDLGGLVYCQEKAVAIISISETCTNETKLHPFLATSIPVFEEWILENDALAWRHRSAANICIVFAAVFTLTIN